MTKTAHHFSHSAIALAVLVAFAPTAHAVDEEVAKLTSPDSGTVSVGVGHSSGDAQDRSISGLYNGRRNDDTNLLLDIDYVKRDNDTGTWIKVNGHNLGQDNRELGFTYEKQGDLKISVDYSELTRNDPRTINTTLQGVGTNTLTVPLPTAATMVKGSGSDVNLKVTRKDFSVTLEKEISHGLQVEAQFKQDDKDGARAWGKGFACTSGAAPLPTTTAQVGCAAGVTQWALLLLPEPIKSTTRQIEAKINYTADKLALSGGYYGSFYNNAFETLNSSIPTSLYNPLGTLTPLATPAGVGMTPMNGLQGIMSLPMYLPPDNQAHEVFMMGNYSFTPTTKANFKAAYTHATQNQDFGAGSGAPAGVSNLGGELNTLFLQAGLSARPMPKLTVKANLQFDDKKDETPIALYNTEGAAKFTNGHVSDQKLIGKLEASYQLPKGYRATLGANYESQDRDQFVSTSAVAGLTALRQKTDETSWRAELRKSLSETLTGAISYESGDRSGSSWQRPCTAAAVTAGTCSATTGVAAVSDSGVAPGYTAFGVTSSGFPMTMQDRERSKWRGMADWSVADNLSLTFMLESGEDTYKDPGAATRGRQSTEVGFYGVDLTYALSDKWKLTAYVSRGEQDLWVAHSTGYLVDLKNTNDAFGLSLKGRPLDKLELTAGLTYANDETSYKQSLDSLAPLSANNLAFYNYQQSIGGMPDVVYRQVALNLSGKYALDKSSALKLDLLYQQDKLDEWSWTNFAFSDGTTVSMKPKQSFTFVGVSYINKFK